MLARTIPPLRRGEPARFRRLRHATTGAESATACSSAPGCCPGSSPRDAGGSSNSTCDSSAKLRKPRGARQAPDAVSGRRPTASGDPDRPRQRRGHARPARSRGTLSLQQRIDFMVAINRDLARDHAQDYARMFEALIALDEGGFLVHCSGRQGPHRVRLRPHPPRARRASADCARGLPAHQRGHRLRGVRAAGARANGSNPARCRTDETIMSLAGVRPEYLRAAFETIETEFEGVERYIEDAIGLDAGKRERLRERLLD